MYKSCTCIIVIPPTELWQRARARLNAQKLYNSCVLSRPQNSGIAREALELLVTCLKLRSSLLNIFYTLPHVEEFVLDVLMGSPHPDVRAVLGDQFYQLCQMLDTGEGGRGRGVEGGGVRERGEQCRFLTLGEGGGGSEGGREGNSVDF